MLSVEVGRIAGVGQAIRAGPRIRKGSVVKFADIAGMVLRVGMDGAVTRVPFDERGAGALFREQIGCSVYDVISLDDRTDMWVDDEGIVGVDMDDRAALLGALNVVATVITDRFGRRRPVFGPVVITGLVGENSAPLDADQLARVESLGEVARALFAEVLAARRQGPKMALTLKLENAYSDGRCSTSVETVEVEAVDDVEELWEHLEEFTGDGHGIGNDLGYCYTITVLDAPGHADLVGLTNEWVGA